MTSSQALRVRNRLAWTSVSLTGCLLLLALSPVSSPDGGSPPVWEGMGGGETSSGGMAIVAGAVPGLAFSMPVPDIPLGTQELKGGGTSQKIDAGAIPQGGTTLYGKICNKTGRAVSDVTISVVGDKTTPASGTTAEKKPPTSSGTTEVTRPGPSGASDAATNTPRVSEDGFQATVTFSNCGKLDTDDCLGFEVSIESAGTASLLTIYYTPSTTDQVSSCEADILQTLSLDRRQPGGLVALEDPGHDRSSVYLRNAEEPRLGGKAVVALEGACRLPEGVALQAVHLQDPSSGFATPSGTNIVVTGDTFLVSGFKPLGPGETYEVVVVLSSRPASGYKVLIDSTFSEEE